MKAYQAVDKFVNTTEDEDISAMWELAYIFSCSKSGRKKIIEALKNSEHFEEFLEECGIEYSRRG